MTGTTARIFIVGLGLTVAAISGQARAAVFNIAGGDEAGLIAAIDTAETNGEADTINLAAGTYSFTGTAYAFPFYNLGLPFMTTEITISGAGEATTVIERDAGEVDPMTLLGVVRGANVTLKDLTLRAASQHAIYLTDFGEAKASGPPASILTLTRVTVENCTALDSIFEEGAAIYYDARGWRWAQPKTGPNSITITDSTFRNNSAALSGGAISLWADDVTITGSVFEGNSAADGGAIRYGGDPGGPGARGELKISDTVRSRTTAIRSLLTRGVA